MNDIKTKVEMITKSYISLFPDDYKNVGQYNNGLRENLKKNFAEIVGSDMIVRQLCNIPEALYTAIKMKLSEDDMEWFKSKKGQEWFGKKFPSFNISVRRNNIPR